VAVLAVADASHGSSQLRRCARRRALNGPVGVGPVARSGRRRR
jgi:hypothetical protein